MPSQTFVEATTPVFFAGFDWGLLLTVAFILVVIVVLTTIRTSASDDRKNDHR